MKEWTRRAVGNAWDKLKPRDHHSKREQQVRKGIIAVLGVALAGAALLFLYTIYLVLFVLPSPGSLKDMNLTESTLIMDRQGSVLYAIHGEENRKSLESLDDISPWLQEATIAIEDDQFYRHIGIDIPGLIKAVLSEIGIGSPRGGSTITQQFVKNTFLNSDRTIQRKFKEIILALRLELKFSKDDILLMYLNAIPYGSNAYGIELAANRYFGKTAAELDLGESAVLASIPQAPTRYSPYGNYRYSNMLIPMTEESLGDRVIEGEQDLSSEEWVRGLIGQTFTMPDGSTFYLRGRSDLVLERMLDLGMINEDEKIEAQEKIKTLAFTPYRDTIAAPHFVLWIKELLEEKYGAPVVEQGGLKVYTTLDPDFQKAAEEAVAAQKDRNAQNYGADDAAMVVTQPKTGQILAMVGSADYFDDSINGQVNMATAYRQPGSSFKPFVYALAFLNRYTPATVLYDVKTNFGNWTPKNYAGDFRGPMTIREALGQSRNIPAIKAYFLAGQQEALIPFAKSFGFTFPLYGDKPDIGPSMALGVMEASPLEMAEAYGVFANMGNRVPLTPILKIENAEGEVLEQFDETTIKPNQVLDPQVAFLINDILSDPSVSLGGNVRVESLDNAAKTGTSTDTEGNPNDAWIAAYTPSLVSIVWTGKANGEPMKGNADGYNNAAPIWKGFATAILDRLEPASWPRPESIKEVAISKASGKLPTELTPSEMIKTEVFADFSVPTEPDDAYQKVAIETISNRRATPYSPVRYVEEKIFRIHRSILADRWPSWEKGVQDWAASINEPQPPAEFADDIHNATTAANVPQIVISDPLTLTGIPADQRTIDVSVEIPNKGNGIKEVEYSMNDIIQYHATTAPYTGTIRLPLNATPGMLINISATVIDQYGYNSTSTIQIRVDQAEETSYYKSIFSRYFGRGKMRIFQ